jgi:hypothetical protein
MAKFNWKFDVAISFSGADRDAAFAIAEALRQRNINVFYDEWHQYELWGQDLSTILPSIYSTATLCVILISKAYSTSPYPKHELRTLLERLVLNDSDFLLPVKLDSTDLPGINKTIVFADYTKEGPEIVAEWVARRLATASAVEIPFLPSATTSSEKRYMLKSHVRQLPSTAYVINEKDLVSAFLSPQLFATPLGRARLARELSIYLNRRCKASLGVPYGAWRENNKVFLSALPEFDVAQKTLEFELKEPHDSLVLTAVWTTEDEKYSGIPYSAWQPAVKGLTADRADLDLDREVVIKILEDRGAQFGFPIVPSGDKPEKLCGWLQEEPPPNFEEWSRDPRLVSGKITVWHSGYHRPSGVGILQFSLEGRWSATAFHTLTQTIHVLLPGRYQIYTVGHGLLRIAVLLYDNPENKLSVDGGVMWAAVGRVYAVLARMVAAIRGLPLPPPQDSSALPHLDPRTQSSFDWALKEQGPNGYTEFVDGASVGFEDASWVKLRHGVSVDEPRRLSLDDLVLPSEITEFVRDNENQS